MEAPNVLNQRFGVLATNTMNSFVLFFLFECSLNDCPRQANEQPPVSDVKCRDDPYPSLRGEWIESIDQYPREKERDERNRGMMFVNSPPRVQMANDNITPVPHGNACRKQYQDDCYDCLNVCHFIHSQNKFFYSFRITLLL